MITRLLVFGLVMMIAAGFSFQAPVHAGGIAMPVIEEAAEPVQEAPAQTAEPVQKMPVFEYEESKMPADDQAAAGIPEKTWVWVLLGFAAAVFVTSL